MIDIVKFPVLKVKILENNIETNHVYELGNHEISPYNFYISTENAISTKDEQEFMNIGKVLFLPISLDKWDDKDNYFFGYVYNFAFMQTSLGIIGIPESKTIDIQFKYDVRRIRYYPDGDSCICIDRIYDPLVPIQIRKFITVDQRAVGSLLDKIISEVIKVYNTWYVDKTI